MTREEAKRQALGRLKLSLRPAQLDLAGQIADEILEPMAKRDNTMVDGLDGKLLKVRPFNYGPAEVLALERAIRRRMTP